MQMYSLADGVYCKASALAASASARNTFVSALNLCTNAQQRILIPLVKLFSFYYFSVGVTCLALCQRAKSHIDRIKDSVDQHLLCQLFGNLNRAKSVVNCSGFPRTRIAICSRNAMP